MKPQISIGCTVLNSLSHNNVFKFLVSLFVRQKSVILYRLPVIVMDSCKQVEDLCSRQDFKLNTGSACLKLSITGKR